MNILKLFKQNFIKGGAVRVIITSLFATLACTGIIYAATTVGTNISTTGTMNVGGNATTTGSFYVGGNLTVGAAILNDLDSLQNVASMTEAQGDLLYHNGTAWTRKALGTDAQILISDGTDLNYRTLSGDATIDNTGAVTVTGASGDFTVTGTVTSPRYDLTTTNTIVGSATTGNSITTGLQNTLIGTVTGSALTTGSRNICIGRLSCEVLNSGSFNIMLAGYSGADTVSGNGNTQVGGHSVLTGESSDFNSVYGFQAGGPGYYPDYLSYYGQHNMFIGANTGYLGTSYDIGTYAHASDYVSLMGYGASAGTYPWKTVTGISGTGTSAVTVAATAHGYSNGDLVSFRDFKKEIILLASAGDNACALSPSGVGLIGYFKVTNAAANTFDLQWCRSANGATSKWSGNVCTEWNTAEYNADVLFGTNHVNFSTCSVNSTNAFVHKLNSTAYDYDFMSVVGSMAVGNKSNAVFLGRKEDITVVGGPTTYPVKELNSTQNLDIASNYTTIGSDAGTNLRTDSIIKTGGMLGVHKLCCDGVDDEESFNIISYRTSGANHFIEIGGDATGNLGDLNAVQRIGFHTAPNYTTLYGTEAARIDNNTTAGNTRFMLYDVDNGTLERVSVGAADSGGVGYKVLRIPN